MKENNFINFTVKLLDNKEIETKYKWKTKSNTDKMKVIDAFQKYCNLNKTNGQIFKELSRKAMVNWMKKEYSIKPALTAKLYTTLQKEIAEYDNKVMGKIEQIEKERTEKYNGPYYLKLFHYFCAAKYDFICIQSFFTIPQNIKNALFIISNGKNNHQKNDEICFTKLTNIFSNVQHIAFTELTAVEMMQSCAQFCKSIIKYQQNSYNQNKRLKSTKFISMNMSNSKELQMVKKLVKQYQLKTSEITIKYNFEYKLNHVIKFDINSIKTSSNFQPEDEEDKESESNEYFSNDDVGINEIEHKYEDVDTFEKQQDNSRTNTQIINDENENKNVWNASTIEEEIKIGNNQNRTALIETRQNPKNKKTAKKMKKSLLSIKNVTQYTQIPNETDS
eukprot:258152_1